MTNHGLWIMDQNVGSRLRRDQQHVIRWIYSDPYETISSRIVTLSGHFAHVMLRRPSAPECISKWQKWIPRVQRIKYERFRGARESPECPGIKYEQHIRKYPTWHCIFRHFSKIRVSFFGLSGDSKIGKSDLPTLHGGPRRYRY